MRRPLQLGQGMVRCKICRTRLLVSARRIVSVSLRCRYCLLLLRFLSPGFLSISCGISVPLPTHGWRFDMARTTEVVREEEPYQLCVIDVVVSVGEKVAIIKEVHWRQV